MSISFTDEFAGQGGTYLLDPATGVRTLIERTEDKPAAAPVTIEQPADPVAYEGDSDAAAQ